ncbi:NADAR family protein [Ideonella azotifigens]|uniref:N-glycosidase YbiA n=1 Tax=Ideonella azotifigens TaxID=513160 RepID=A0ABP3VKQ0_9BURK|nr:NADAR family protein [Ideonella azotifigens]MCD2343005.1 NADAR family protein [Ideonella azotifigens]
MAKPIHFFAKTDAYHQLSNFAPFGFEEGGLRWPTVEHYFQAQKFIDLGHRERILKAHSPQQAKTLGQSRAFPIRDDWDQIKDAVMKHALLKKFEDPTLRLLLLETKSRPLIENSPYDRYWGIGRDGKGKNVLGRLLAEVRTEIRNADQANTRESAPATHARKF